MKTKIVKEYLYDGLGIPVLLHNVTMLEYEGEWHPKIDVREVANREYDRILNKHIYELTKEECEFICNYALSEE